MINNKLFRGKDGNELQLVGGLIADDSQGRPLGLLHAVAETGFTLEELSDPNSRAIYGAALIAQENEVLPTVTNLTDIIIAQELIDFTKHGQNLEAISKAKSELSEIVQHYSINGAADENWI